jgi:hypothetical protein
VRRSNTNFTDGGPRQGGHIHGKPTWRLAGVGGGGGEGGGGQSGSKGCGLWSGDERPWGFWAIWKGVRGGLGELQTSTMHLVMLVVEPPPQKKVEGMVWRVVGEGDFPVFFLHASFGLGPVGYASAWAACIIAGKRVAIGACRRPERQEGPPPLPPHHPPPPQPRDASPHADHTGKETKAFPASKVRQFWMC